MSDGTPSAALFAALGTTAVVSVTEPTLLRAARDMLAAELDAVDRACSRFRPDSELAWVNGHAGAAVPVGKLLAEAVRVALDGARRSDGYVDPTLGVHLRAVGYDRTFALVRERDSWRIEETPPPGPAWKEIGLDEEAQLLFVPEGVELDLGATAKAWAADRASSHIATKLSTGALVCLGGDVAVAGPPPAGGWTVRIADDHAAPLDGPGPVVAISSGGLATSGTGVRCWPTDRGEAHHILDPRSGLPAITPWRSVSVAAATCVDANLASTTAIVLGEPALDWLSERRLPARAVRHDGSVSTVGGWPAAERAA